MTNIHNTSIIDSKAIVSETAQVGPFCIIGPNVTIGDNVSLISNISITGNTYIGDNTKIYPFATLGQDPQHSNYKGESSTLRVGKNNIIRESVTMHPGTKNGNMETIIGNNCLFMVGSHIAHDCMISDNVILTNSVALGGHVIVEEYAIIGGLAGIHQYVRIGKHSMVGGCSAVENDVIPYGSVKGNRAKLAGLNLIGLRRRGFSRDEIRSLRTAYGLIFTQGGKISEKITEVSDLFNSHDGVMDIISFMKVESSRGICQPTYSNGNGN